MTSSRRVTLALAVLGAVFVAVSGYAAVTLLALNDVLLAGVAVIAGIACVGATALTWWLARELDAAPVATIEETQAPGPHPRITAQVRTLPIQSRPVAELPPAYLDAVMKGAQAHREAWKARSTQY